MATIMITARIPPTAPPTIGPVLLPVRDNIMLNKRSVNVGGEKWREGEGEREREREREREGGRLNLEQEDC